jgi:hypothetical protein
LSSFRENREEEKKENEVTVILERNASGTRRRKQRRRSWAKLWLSTIFSPLQGLLLGSSAALENSNFSLCPCLTTSLKQSQNQVFHLHVQNKKEKVSEKNLWQKAAALIFPRAICKR